MKKSLWFLCLVFIAPVAGAQFIELSPYDSIDFDNPPSYLHDKRFYRSVRGGGKETVALVVGGYSDGKKHGEFLHIVKVYNRWVLSKVENYSHGILDGYRKSMDYANYESGYYKNGKKDGMWILDTSSDVPGDVEHIEYRMGVRHGSYKLESELETITGNYYRGKKQGLWVTERTDVGGKPFEVIKEYYRRDVLHGEYERSGIFLTTGRYRHGKKHGAWVSYWGDDENREEIKREIYKNGALIETIEKEPEISIDRKKEKKDGEFTLGGMTSFGGSLVFCEAIDDSFLLTDLGESVVHELFHTLRLGYPFEITQTNNSDRFKETTTTNMMDYYTEEGDKRDTFFSFQWEAMQQEIKKYYS